MDFRIIISKCRINPLPAEAFDFAIRLVHRQTLNYFSLYPVDKLETILVGAIYQ